ncbi:MAG: SRPBCC family protein [Candidatus Aramenus sp.]|jgi:carbon monoxide dehydrogenase subunit G|nr:SRPBCC family protein [Candidatus Aramenus sp.]
MEVSYDFEVEQGPDIVKGYLLEPENLMKYVPAFKGIERTGEDEWELKVSWLITLKLKVIRQMTRDEITYLIKKTGGMIKVESYLRFVILPTKGRTVVKLIFFYKGPFEGIAKRQTESFYKRGIEIFKRDMESARTPEKTTESKVVVSGNNQFPSILQMKTVEVKMISAKDVEDVIGEAIAKSLDAHVLLILSDGENVVELKFYGGDVVESKGDLKSLKEPIKVVVKTK